MTKNLESCQEVVVLPDPDPRNYEGSSNRGGGSSSSGLFPAVGQTPKAIKTLPLSPPLSSFKTRKTMATTMTTNTKIMLDHGDDKIPVPQRRAVWEGQQRLFVPGTSAVPNGNTSHTTFLLPPPPPPPSCLSADGSSSPLSLSSWSSSSSGMSGDEEFSACSSGTTGTGTSTGSHLSSYHHHHRRLGRQQLLQQRRRRRGGSQERTVRFKKSALVRKTVHRSDIPDDIKQAYWYSKTDLQQIRHQNRALLMSMRHEDRAKKGTPSSSEEEDNNTNVNNCYDDHDDNITSGNQQKTNTIYVSPSSTQTTKYHDNDEPGEDFLFPQRNDHEDDTTDADADDDADSSTPYEPLDDSSSHSDRAVANRTDLDETFWCARGLERMTRQESLARKKRRFQILFVVVHYGNWHRQQQLLQDKKTHHRHSRPCHATTSNSTDDETQADAIARIYSSLCRDAVTYALQRGMEDEYDATCEF